MSHEAAATAETIPVLTSARLLLRAYVPEDAPALFRLFTDERVIRAFGYRMVPTIAAAQSIIQYWQQEFRNKTGIRWHILHQEDGRSAGNIGLKDIKAYHSCGAIGYAVQPDYWRRGIASEALSMVLQYAFDTMQLHRIEAQVFPANKPSQALLVKHGFVQEGMLRSSYRFDEQYHDSCLFGLINPAY